MPSPAASTGSIYIVNPPILCVLFVAGVFASPIPNDIGLRSWVSGPTGRGTFDILKTCITTLILCVWTAIHPDIARSPNPLVSFATRFSWMIVGLFLPELVVILALRQMRKASLLRKQWCEHFDVRCGSQADLMGLRGAYLVGMRGVTLGPRDHFGNYPDIIDGDGYMELIRRGLIPRDFLNKTTIDDKSKADEIAKFVACVQASWMLIQCVVRTAIGLPLTLLEFHVMIQVVCTVVMYGLWWCKPLNVKEPVPITDYRQSEAQRFFYYGGSGWELLVGTVRHNTKSVGLPTSKEEIVSSDESPSSEISTTLPNEPISYPIQVHRFPKAVWFELHTVGNSTPVLLKGLSHVSLRSNTPVPSGESLVTGHKFFLSTLESNAINLTQLLLEDIQKRVQQLYTQEPLKDDMNFREMLHDFCGWMGWSKSLRYVHHFSRFRGIAYSFFYDAFSAERFLSGYITAPGSSTYLLPAMVSFVYGISHVIVWNHYFPSEVDMWVWRISSVMAPIVACWTIFIYCISYRMTSGLWQPPLILVPLAGICLLIESFASLRRVPAGVYQTIPLERYWPHF